MLSILIPTRDEQGWIVHAVRAARASLNSAGVRGEVIVSDAGSRDQTALKARRFADRVLVSGHDFEGRGRPVQLNAAARAARGEVLVMLHADALLVPAAIEAITDTIAAGNPGGWFQVDILPEHHTAAGVHLLGAMAWGINLRTRWFRTATADQCIFCRRDVFEAMGGVPDVALLEGNLFARALRDQGEVAVLGPWVRVSGRRWEKNGLLRTMLLMYGIRAAHRAGVAEGVLARIWDKWSD